MKNFLTGFLVICFFTNALQAQSFNWIKGGGSTHTMPSGTPKESVYEMCTDYNGNVYTLSEIGKTGPIIADTFSLPGGSPGSVENVMFASYTCSGQMRFAKLVSGNQIRPHGLICDTTGHVYMALFALHGSSSVTTLRIGYDTSITGIANQTQMLVQYDTSGDLNWVRFVGDNTTATMPAAASSRNCFVAIDGNNYVHYINTMRYGVPITPTITSITGNYDLKYDVSGSLVSVKRLQIDSTLCFINGVCIDKNSDKLYAYGTRDIYTYPDSTDYPYIAAFDTARNLIWKDTLANPCFSGPGYAAFGAITTDNIGNLYMTGAGYLCATYRSNTVTNGGTGQVGFILKTDTAGSVRWIKGFSATTSVNSFRSIAVTPNGNIATTGLMGGIITSGTHTVVSYAGEGQNSFFAIVDTAGYIDTIQQLHGTGFYDLANNIAVDRTGSLYIGGQAETNTWAGSLTPYTAIGGNSDFYVIKYGVDCGCTSMPVAAYTHTGSAIHSFTYTGTTTPTIDSVRWNFGDGGTSTLLNPTHTYTIADTFTACVRVYTPCGSDLYCQTFIIPCVSAPTPSFSMSGTGLTRTFTYTGTTVGVSSISWSFTGGTGATSGSPVSRTFPAAGTYTVCVTATNPCGTTTTCNPVTVTCTSTPVSSFTVSGVGLSKSFAYTGTTAGLDSVTWTFGDGGTATGLTPGHTYAAAGTYTVCAKVWTNCGVHTYCSPVVVTCTSTPIASFTYSGTGATRTFTYTGTTGGMDSVRWYFGDGGTSTLLNPSHTFTTEDTFHVCVTIYTNCGSHTSCQNIIVTCFLPITSAFTDTGMLLHGFAYTGTTAWYDSVRWTFGDGGTDTGLFTIHTYAIADTYHVCAKVYTDCGTHTYCRDIIIPGTGAVSDVSFADIRVNPTPATNELYVTGVPERMAYRLLNVVGVVTAEGTFNTGTNIIQAQQLPPGMYILEMTNDNGVKNVVRIIKQ
jgi:PKD repeat protein